MTTDATGTSAFLPIAPAARLLGVPVKWLRREAEAGRVPHLRVGPRLLVHLGGVERTLLERAEESTEVPA